MIQNIIIFIIIMFAIGGISMFFSNKRVDPETAKGRWLKYGTYLMIVSLTIASGIIGRLYFTSMMMSLGAIGLFELLKAISGAKHHFNHKFMSGLILVLYFLVLAGLYKFCINSTPERVVFVYLLVAVFDGFSQITGQLVGRTKITPQVSPNKTLEGLLGGLIMSSLTGVVFRSLLDLRVVDVLIASLLLALATFAGDIAASWIKRWTGVKDFGRLLPGHGGILDRFDGFFVAAGVTSLLIFFSNRSL